eukprot:scaffold472_cov264-Pinguiococcus_pyrenoidosus.AAC.7
MRNSPKFAAPKDRRTYEKSVLEDVEVSLVLLGRQDGVRRRSEHSMRHERLSICCLSAFCGGFMGFVAFEAPFKRRTLRSRSILRGFHFGACAASS